MRELALDANARLDGAPAERIVEWAADEFGERFCVTSSMADALLAHVVSKVLPGVAVVFLDTDLQASLAHAGATVNGEPSIRLSSLLPANADEVY